MNCTQARVTSHIHRALLIILVMSTGTILHADESERRLLLPLNVVTHRFCAIPTCDRPPIPVTVLHPGFAAGEFENRGTPGRFVFHPASAQLDLNLRARDSSRDPFSYGTEVPVVEAAAFRSRPFSLLAVQSTEPFRAMLRVYGVTASTVTVRALRQADNLVLDQWSLPLSSPGNEYEPAYAQLPLPAWGISLVRIEITPQSEQFPVFAFASVTSNISQQFRLVTPRQVH